MGSRIKWVWDFHLLLLRLGKIHIHMYIQLLYMFSGRNARLNSEFHISFCCCAVLFVYTEIIVYVVDIGRNDVKKLFEFWCEVQPTRGIDRGSISRNGGGTATPAGVIIESFPEGFRDKEVLTGIPSFAFPCDLERWVHTHTHTPKTAC